MLKLNTSRSIVPAQRTRERQIVEHSGIAASEIAQGETMLEGRFAFTQLQKKSLHAWFTVRPMRP